MNISKTTPNDVLVIWENNFGTLNAVLKQEFKEHPITANLCTYSVTEIKAAIVLDRAQYLPDILRKARFYSRVKLKGAMPQRPALVPNPNTSKYDKYICFRRVTHGRKDECRCRVAA